MWGGGHWGSDMERSDVYTSLFWNEQQWEQGQLNPLDPLFLPAGRSPGGSGGDGNFFTCVLQRGGVALEGVGSLYYPPGAFILNLSSGGDQGDQG